MLEPVPTFIKMTHAWPIGINIYEGTLIRPDSLVSVSLCCGLNVKEVGHLFKPRWLE